MDMFNFCSPKEKYDYVKCDKRTIKIEEEYFKNNNIKLYRYSTGGRCDDYIYNYNEFFDDDMNLYIVFFDENRKQVEWYKFYDEELECNILIDEAFNEKYGY